MGLAYACYILLFSCYSHDNLYYTPLPPQAKAICPNQALFGVFSGAVAEGGIAFRNMRGCSQKGGALHFETLLVFVDFGGGLGVPS